MPKPCLNCACKCSGNVLSFQVCRPKSCVVNVRICVESQFFLLIVHVRPLHSSIFDGFEQHHVVFFKNFLLLTRTCKGRAICFKIRSWSTILDADLHLNVISLPIRKKKTKQNKLHSKMKRKQNRNCIKSRKMQINCLPHSLFYKAEY